MRLTCPRFVSMRVVMYIFAGLVRLCQLARIYKNIFILFIYCPGLKIELVPTFFFSALKLRSNNSSVNFDKHFDCRISCVISVRFDLKRVVVYISAWLVLLCRAYPDIQKEEYQLYFLSRSQNKAYVLKCLCRLRNFDPTSVREFRPQILSSSFSRDCFLLRLDTSACV